MRQLLQNIRVQAFKQRVFEAFKNVFDNPVGRPAKKAIITVIGVFITLIGLLLIVLPGPGSLIILVGLAILALEYPSARVWLRKFQTFLSVSAKKADNFVDRVFKKRANQ
ncbi:MAG: PGPGW domain-containing protein [Kangiellaceae bacterium]